MGDLREMLQRLRQDLQEPNIVNALKEEHDQAQLAIIDSIREEQHQEYWFNVGNHSFPTVPDQETYDKANGGLPADFLFIISEKIYQEISQNSEQVWYLDRMTTDKYDYWAAVLTTRSFPRYWRYFDNQIWLTPRPNDTIHNEKFRYLKDLGVPRKRHDGTFAADGKANWVFDDPTWGSSEIAQAWQADDSGGPSFIDLTVDINDEDLADVSPFPAVAEGDDALYLGFAIRPTSLLLNIAVAGAGAVAYVIVWQYSQGNGTFVNLEDVVDGSSSFTVAGQVTVSYTDPGTAWKRDVVNGSDLLFWVRAKVDGDIDVTDPLLSQVEGEGNASPWMNEAERLIRRRAAYLLCKDYLKDPERANAYLQGALEARQDLRERHASQQKLWQIESWI